MNIQKYTQEQLDEVKASFTGEDAVQLYGIQKKGHSILCPCPDHNDTHFGSCNVTKQGDYHCFVCRKTWSGIDFIQFMEGVKFLDAVEKAASLGGVTLKPSQEWINDRNKWFRQKGLDIPEPATVTRTCPRLSREDAELIGIPYGSNRILSPINCTDDIAARSERGVYRESDITGRFADPEDDTASDLYILCKSLQNPHFFLPHEDPEAYSWLVITHIDAKLEDLRQRAKRYLPNDMSEVVAEIDRLCRHLKELRSEYEPSLKQGQARFKAAG